MQCIWHSVLLQNIFTYVVIIVHHHSPWKTTWKKLVPPFYRIWNRSLGGLDYFLTVTPWGIYGIWHLGPLILSLILSNTLLFKKYMDWLVMQSLCSFAPASIPLLQLQWGVTASRTHSILSCVQGQTRKGHFWRTSSQERQHLWSNRKRRWSQVFRPLDKEWHVANYSHESLGIA